MRQAMVQQINLYDEALRPQRQRWRAAHGLWVVGGTLVAAFALSSAMQAVSQRRLAEAERLEQLAATERTLTARNGGTGSLQEANRQRIAELERLRAADAGQRRVHAVLDQQVAGRKEGYTAYFMALSRQAHASLWITGFGVGADGETLELQGRMADAAVLPDYLRRLNAEPRFKGRSFAQLSMKVVDPRGDATAVAPYTEFVLRSQQPGAAAAEAHR
ncbi:PilN domain-containing protein [Ideonella sp. BN130291]|uniref:PilN domain-containing protein n=1 Tax=Ideonella sp. BN130291 TaxID=3112940 RepID=UPI002E25F82D|nr:PilN domain-containing protein [Ideonella sp. BN130291]